MTAREIARALCEGRLRYRVEQWTRGDHWATVGDFETLADADAVAQQAAQVFLGVRVMDTQRGIRVWAILRGGAR